MPIYTKTGDTGETALYGGKRVKKSHTLVAAYGAVDELSCWIGKIVVLLHIDKEQHLADFLLLIQKDLFLIGGCLAGWKADLGLIQTRITEIEVEIDTLETQLPELRNFILPGGSLRAAEIHIVRSVVRRVERQIVSLGDELPDSIIMQYLNRLSDLLFVVARYITMIDGGTEVVWTPTKP